MTSVLRKFLNLITNQSRSNKLTNNRLAKIPSSHIQDTYKLQKKSKRNTCSN